VPRREREIGEGGREGGREGGGRAREGEGVCIQAPSLLPSGAVLLFFFFLCWCMKKEGVFVCACV